MKLSSSDSGRNDLIEGPYLGGYLTIADGASMTMSGAACGRPVGDLAPEEQRRVYYYTIFPNMLLSLHHDYVMVHSLWPKSPDRTIVECQWLFHPDAVSQPGFHADDAIEFWDVTNREDWRMCELSQLGVSSRAYRPGPYSGRESLLAAFDREWRTAIA